MKKARNSILLHVLLLVFIASIIIGTAGIIPANAEEKVQAIRGIPKLISQPAAEEDIEYLNSDKYGKSSISFKQLPLLESSRTFTAYNPGTNTYDEVSFKLKRIGEHSYIYLEEGNQTVTDTMLDNIVSRFESIYDENVRVFGTPPDIDKDKRINILLMDIRDSNPYSYIAGFFDSINQLPKANNHPESNESEIFYMDINEGLPDSRYDELNFYGTLAHEFQHMIQYGTYLRNYTSVGEPEDTWLNEALSCLAEYINLDAHPEDQIEEFLADNFASGFGLIDWDPYGNLANYGASYMFALYMYENFGTKFITDLAQDPETGIQSIENQLMALGENMDFDELFERFQVAVLAGSDYEFGFDAFDTIYLREPSYIGDGEYHPDMKFDSYLGPYSGGSQYIFDTHGGKYRGFAVFLGSNEIYGYETPGALNLKFAYDTGTYYIVKSSDPYDISNNYEKFARANKIVEKIQPDLAGGNIVELGRDQWALLIYIAKDSPISNSLTVTEVSPPTHSEGEKPSTPEIISHEASYNSVTLRWKPSSYIDGIEGYNVYRDSGRITEYPVMATSYTDLNVNAGTTYEYQIEAVGWDGKLSEKSVAETVYTAPAPDLAAPGAPTISFVATGAIPQRENEANIIINLAAPENFPDIDHYEVISLLDGMEDGFFKDITSPGNLNLSVFNPGSVYTLYAFAVDAAGNYSPASNKLYVKAGTGAVSPSAPPTPPSNVTATVKETKVELSWTASTQAEGILEYNVYRDGVFIGKTAGNTAKYTDSGLTAGTTYTYTIEAVGKDPENLNSDYSQPFTAATVSGPPALTADTTDNSIDKSLVITFADNALWRTSITSIKVDGTALSTSKYSVSAGKITIYPYALSTVGNHTISAIADGYSPSQVVQAVTAAPSVPASGGSSDGGGGGGGGGNSGTATAAPTAMPGEIIFTAKTLNEQINSTTSNTVQATITGTDKGHTAVFPADLISLINSKGKGITVSTNEISIIFTSKVASTDFNNLPKDSELKIGIRKLDSDTLTGTLPSESANIIKGLHRLGKNVFRLEAKLAAKDKTTDLTNFSGDISITVSLKNADLSKTDPDKLGVYYFNEKSKAWEYAGGKYNPAAKTITFSTDHFSYYTVMAFEKSFSDIKGHWAQADIEKLAARHVFRNIAEEQFNPNAKVTRAEFIAMLVRALELKAAGVEPVAFKDIAADKYYYGEVQTAWKLGITNGDGTGKFRPGDNITREQLAAMIYRALTYLNKAPVLTEEQITGKLAAYTDKDNVSSFAKLPMAAALEKKIINGWKTDLLAPKENATRAEAAVMIRRLLGGL